MPEHDADKGLPCAQLTYEYQINQPPPLGHPDCQFPELTLPGMCANMIVYIPSTPNAVRGPAALCLAVCQAIAGHGIDACARQARAGRHLAVPGPDWLLGVPHQRPASGLHLEGHAWAVGGIMV